MRRAGAYAAGSVAVAALTVIAASAGAGSLAVASLVAMVGLAACARHWVRLAGRSRAGARSENEVQRVLSPLWAEGWRLRHSLVWARRGDIDSVAIAPTGIAFAIETKTRSYEPQHLTRTREMATWLRSRRRRWCRSGALPVLCIARAHQLERIETGVLVVSLDRLTSALRVAAGTTERPAFLSAVPGGSSRRDVRARRHTPDDE
jgi:hypothetical protein